jgi:2-methylisocitrate lyase-like PEP mutase family enzyme
MDPSEQKTQAERFRQMHRGPSLLVLPNAWDAASARIFELAGFPAIATTSSGMAAALGYGDGQQISRDMLIAATARIARVIACPVTVDVEAGYGTSIPEISQTVEAIVKAGAVGINIEDSLKQGERALADIPDQVALLKALRELSASLDIPFVINARVDVFLLAIGEPESRLEQAASRANAYLEAGADCVYPIGTLASEVIADLVKAIDGPVNILSGPSAPSLAEMAQLGVARVSFGSGLMRSALGHLRVIARELIEQGSTTKMEAEALSGAEFQALFAHQAKH